MKFTFALVLAFFATPLCATIPDAYKPIVVKAPFSLSSRVFDLTQAVDRARAENKPLYIYLGADDCLPCGDYYRFLENNHDALREAFARVVLVDIRSWLRVTVMEFKVGERRFSFDEFKALVGDKSKGSLTYPYFWLLTPELKQIKQLPRGSRHYMPVDKQLNILRLP
jgi:hypothetical protein